MLSPCRCTGRRVGILLSLLLSFQLFCQTTSTPREEKFERATNAIAAEDYERALSIYREITLGPGGSPYGFGPEGGQVVDSLSGLAFHKMGVVNFNYLGDDEAAVNAYREALRVREAVYPTPHNDLAKTLNNLATALHYTERVDSAIVFNRRAIDIYEQLGAPDSVNWLRAYNELGRLAHSSRDYQIAYSSSFRALELLGASSGFGDYDVFDTYYAASRVLEGIGEYETALALADSAYATAEAAEDPYLIADANVIRANALMELGREEDGYRANLATLRMMRELGMSDVIEGYANLNVANYLGERGRAREALAYDRRAREVFTAVDAPDEYLFNSELPLRLADLGRLTEGIDTLDRWIARLDGREVGERYLPIVLRQRRASLLERAGRAEAALADYDRIFALEERLRREVTGETSRRYLSENLRPLLDSAINLYASRYFQRGTEEDAWRAFELSDRARAYSLLLAVEAGREGQPRRLRQLRMRIAALEREVAAGNEEKRSPLEKARLELDRQLYNLQSGGERVGQDLRRDLLIDSLRAGGSHLLEYHLTAGRAYVFHISPEGTISLDSIAGAGRITDLVDRWRAAIRDGQYRRKSLREPAEQAALDAAFLTLGETLGAALIPRSLSADFGDDPVRLIVVADGALSYLPFAALPLRRPGTEPVDYAGVDYLLRRAELSYAYAARQLLLTRDWQASTDYARDLLALAPSFRGEAASDARGMRTINGLRPLRYNTEEVDRVATFVGAADILAGDAASRASFLNLAPGSRIVHLSTHGLVSARDPNLSFVAFTQRGDSLEPEELLYFNDLYALPLDNELTVLSACETSLGELAPGETPLSLASAFAAAGARSTLTTLWEVDDRATMELIVSFYEQLADGRDRSAALREAQLSLLDGGDFAHPYYWAAASLHGESGALALQGEAGIGFGSFWPLLLIGLIALGVAIYLIRR